jgi:hypothetical protein
MARQKLIIAPRRNPGVLMMLAQEFAEDQTVEVIADRRLGERRRPSSSRDRRPERRWHDRRGTCPFCFQCVFVD